jgi:hypothetical protein
MTTLARARRTAYGALPRHRRHLGRLGVVALDLDGLAELFLDQVALVQLLVVGGDGGQ